MGDEMKKVYLIGYMGCGKSAIGKRLSFATKIPYYDMDTEIVKKMGMTIPEIFEKYGEEHFRELETEFFARFVMNFVLLRRVEAFRCVKKTVKLCDGQALSFFLMHRFAIFGDGLQQIKNAQLSNVQHVRNLKSYLMNESHTIYRVAHFKVETENRSLRDIMDYIAFQIRQT